MQDVPRSSLAFWVRPEAEDARYDADEDDYPDVRYTAYRRDRQIYRDEDLSDSDDEDEDDIKRRQKGSPGKPLRNYHNHGDNVEHARYVTLKSDTERPGVPEEMIRPEQHAKKLSPIKRLIDTNVNPAGSPARTPAKAWLRNPADDPRCECCKVGKTKCDKARPFCSTCVRRNRQDRCLYRRLDGTIGPDPGAALALVEGIGIANMELD